MARITSLFKKYWIRYSPAIVLACTCFFLGVAGWSAIDGFAARSFNNAYKSGAILKYSHLYEDGAEHYAKGYIYLAQGNTKKAIHYFTLAESSDDIQIRSQAKLALGNVYFEPAIKSADIQSGEGHIRGIAQIELAREAYKGALRLDPNLGEARYNLELLDRLSPPKRYEGWEREVEGVTLVPQKRDGWASMKDNTRRGLP
jgi:tetratricopeptide (TPR) repeat protein